MKARLLGLGFIVMDALIITYYVRMIYGWQEVLRIARATGVVLSMLFMFILAIVGIALLIGEDFDD